MFVASIRLFALIAAAALAASGPAVSGQALAEAKLQSCVAAEAKKAGFSGVISIRQPGGAVTSAHGSMAGPESPPMLPDAQFNVGSAGKMWTAVAVAQLIDAKKISLDDPIGRSVSGLTPETSAVTIRQLLTHSGGLGSFFSPENLGALKRAKSLSDLKPLIVGETPKFTPGSRFDYSNTGFLLLGLMIEQVSGKSYSDYLQAHVFGPAGMTRSGMTPAAADIRAAGMTNWPDFEAVPRQVAGPAPAGPAPGDRSRTSGGPDGPRPPPLGPLRPSTEAELVGSSAGNGYSTPSDMQRFFVALLDGKLTSKAMLAALTSPQIAVLPARGDAPAIHYGFGFSVSEYKSHGGTGHNGGLPGGNVATMAFVKDQVTIVVMANRDPPAADAMIRKIQSILFDDGACGS